MNRLEILAAIEKERFRQIEKWGEGTDYNLYLWLAILGEEVGECFKAALQIEYEHTKTMNDLRNELIQTASVCYAILENYFKES